MAGTTTKSRRTQVANSDVNDLLVQFNKLVDQVSYLEGSATYDPASLVDGAGATTTVTVTGAALGDYAQASFSLDLQGILLTAYVSAANTVAVRFQNETTGTLDLASGTINVRVQRNTSPAGKIGDVGGTAITA